MQCILTKADLGLYCHKSLEFYMKIIQIKFWNQNYILVGKLCHMIKLYHLRVRIAVDSVLLTLTYTIMYQMNMPKREMKWLVTFRLKYNFFS